MSEEDRKVPSVCEKFEPQAWRKTVCKNCFQSPDVHTIGSVDNGDKATSGGVKGKPDSIIPVDKKTAASSLKNKYEQLEKDKYKPKETASNTLPRTKKAGGLSLITDKYDQLDREAGKLDSPTKHIPPPTPPKPSKKDGSMIAKFGSMENVSAEIDISDHKLGMKFKFGSMENISNVTDKKKDTVLSPLTQKPKFGGSTENISTSDKDGRLAMLSKLDSFQNEVKEGTTSKAGKTVVHKQKDGHVDIITLPSKSGDSKTNESSKLKSKDSSVKVNEKLDTKSKFEKPELKSTSDKDKSLSKVEPKSKFSLKSTNEPEKVNELKGAKELLSNKLRSTKTEETTVKPPEKDLRGSLKKPELKSTGDKEEPKLLSLKDKLSKPTDKLKTDEPKKLALSLKDQLKSPTVDPLSKLKEKLKSPETDTKQAPSWKDRLKSPVDTDKKTDTQSKLSKSEIKTEPDAKLKPTMVGTTAEKDKAKAAISNDKKQEADKLGVTKSKENIPEDKSNTKLDTGSKFSSRTDPKSDNKKSVDDLKFGSNLNKVKDKESENKTPLGAKLGIKSNAALTEKSKSENEVKPADKNDLKSKFNKFSKDEETKPKTIDLRNTLKKSSDSSAGDKDSSKLDTKKKFDLPSLKSSKTPTATDKSKENDAKEDSSQDKPPNKIGNRFEPKFKLNKTNEPKPSVTEEKTNTKAKFELPKLKSKNDQNEDNKSSLKPKFEPKTKLNDPKTDIKNKFEIPSLKKLKAPEHEELKTKDKNSTKSDDKSVDIKKPMPVATEDKDSTKDSAKTSVKEKLSTKDDKKITNGCDASTNVDSAYDLKSKNEKDKEEYRNKESNDEKSLDSKTPDTSAISAASFGKISSDGEVVSGDACAQERTRDTKSPLHVDTQVFTSSRSKTAGVTSLDDTNFDNKATGFSTLGLTKSNKQKSPPKDTPLVNGDISLEHTDGKKEKKTSAKNAGSKITDDELERLKAELLNMTERCQNLETENEMLRSDLNNKTLNESNFRKQKDDAESAMTGLKGQLKTMEEKCSKLESENINMMNDLKSKHDVNQNKPQNKDSDEMEDKLTAKEKLMEDLLEENDQLKQEINELKVEMEEMYDSFRDQEAEEFREIQKELEYTAKNCRILQFKLRKMERRNEQLEQDKNQFEERLRKLQNSFQDRDAVSHIHSLEDELRLAKEVSVRLHDELDLMEDRRSKVEEENRHLTELLEQADRKQFRLELEVDKLRDKVVELRQELRMREGGADGNEPRKLNCAEFLALHRETT